MPTPDNQQSRSFSNAEIADAIDHALLHPTMTDSELEAGCRLAAELKLKSVCVKPYAVSAATDWLKGTTVLVGTVIGFPSGSHSPKAKAAEAELACMDGASELDMVINVGKTLQHDWDFVRLDIDSVLQVARQYGAILKVIFETDYVMKEHDLRTLCQLCVDLGVDFTKTSTGFGFNKVGTDYNYVGATEEAIRLMVAECLPSVQVKASGGIRSREDAVKFLSLGCTRLGTSASQAILQASGPDGSGY